MAKNQAQRGHGEKYGGGSEFRVAGMTRAETQAALELAKAVKNSNLSFARQVEILKKNLGK